jgi:uncharacterized protein (UPF0179 family)
MSKYEKWVSYVFETTLPGNKKVVKFRPLKTKNLKRFLTVDDSIGSIENAIDDVLQDCILDDTDVQKLYLQDRFFLLMEVRKKSKGSKYKFEYTCSKCGSQSMQEIDLDIMKVKEPSVYEEEVQINENITVVLNLLTRENQKEATRLANNFNAQNEFVAVTIMDSAMITHSLGIKKVITPDGIDEPSISDKVELVNELSPQNYGKIRDWYDDKDFGVEMKYNIKCPHCLFEQYQEVPMDNFFF